jgi:hypothetical protein
MLASPRMLSKFSPVSSYVKKNGFSSALGEMDEKKDGDLNITTFKSKHDNKAKNPN